MISSTVPKKRIHEDGVMILRRFTRMVGGWQWMMLMCCFYFGIEQWKKDTRFGCLGYRGDEILPSYVGIIVNHYKDPVIKQPGFHSSSIRPLFFFFVAQLRWTPVIKVKGSSAKVHSTHRSSSVDFERFRVFSSEAMDLSIRVGGSKFETM